MGSHRVGHDWSDLAAASAAYAKHSSRHWACSNEHDGQNHFPPVAYILVRGARDNKADKYTNSIALATGKAQQGRLVRESVDGVTMQYSSRQGMPDKVPEKLVHEYRSKGGEVGSPVDTSGIPAAQDAKALSFGSVTDVLEEWLQSERGQ